MGHIQKHPIYPELPAIQPTEAKDLARPRILQEKLYSNA